MDSSLATDKKLFFFGAVDKLATVLNRAQQEPTILTLRTRTALAMDATGLNALEDLQEPELGRRARNTLEERKGALHAYILAVLNPRDAIFTLSVKVRAASTHA